MTIKPQTPENLEKLIKETFCGLNSVVDCAYKSTNWCPETCGFYKRIEEQVKYAGWRI